MRLHSIFTAVRRPVFVVALAAAGLIAQGAHAAPDDDDDELIQIQFLASTGEDADGRAKMRFRDRGDEQDLEVELEQMDAGTYELFVGGVSRGTFDVSGETSEGEIEFETPLDAPKPLFDFDVFDQQVEVRQGATVFFSDVFAPGGGGGGGAGGGGGGAGNKKGKIEVFMVNVGPDLNAKGRLRHEVKPGETRFKVNLEDLDDGTYDLVVAGTIVSTFDTQGFREVELDFRNPPDDDPDDGDDELEIHALLDFDPLGSAVEVVAADVVFLTGVLPASGVMSGGKPPKNGKSGAKDLGKKKTDKLLVVLHSSGLLFGASGKATFEQDERDKLEIEIEDVSDGAYQVCVGGVERGVLTVTGGEGEIEFSTAPENAELLLDFDVKGQLIAVKSGEDVLLSAVFPTSVQEALGLLVKERRSETQLRLNLVNGGADLDARGTLRFRIKNGREVVRIKAVDLEPGEFTVRVDGVERAALSVTPNGSGRLVFDSNVAPGGKHVPLDFEVQGLLLELVDGDAAVVLRVVLE